jgi:hypothetical protein
VKARFAARRLDGEAAHARTISEVVAPRTINVLVINVLLPPRGPCIGTAPRAW